MESNRMSSQANRILSKVPLIRPRPQPRNMNAAPLLEGVVQKTLLAALKQSVPASDAQGGTVSAWNERILGQTNAQDVADSIYEAAKAKDASAIPAMISLIGCMEGSCEAMKAGLPTEEPIESGAQKTSAAILGEAARTREKEGANPAHNDMPPACIRRVVQSANNARKAFERDSRGERRLVATPLYSQCCDAISNIILAGREPLSDSAVEELIRVSRETADPRVARDIYGLFAELGEKRAVPALILAAQAYECDARREQTIYRLARSSLFQTEIYHQSGLMDIEGPAIFEEAFSRGKDLDVERDITSCMDSLCRSSAMGTDTAGAAIVALRLIGDGRAIAPLKELDFRLAGQDVYLKVAIHRLESIRDGSCYFIDMIEGRVDMDTDVAPIHRKSVENLAGRPINWENPTILDKVTMMEVQEVANLFANPYAPGPR